MDMQRIESCENKINELVAALNILINTLRNPIKVDDRSFAYLVQEAQKMNDSIVKHSGNVDITQAMAEIRYIGQRLKGIEQRLNVMEIGVSQKIKLSFDVDGYEMVKRPQNADKIDDRIMEKEYKEDRLVLLLDTLTYPNMPDVLVRRFALRGGDPQTLDQIGKAIGRSRERVRQMISRALRMLRHPLRVQMVKDVDNVLLSQEVFGKTEMELYDETEEIDDRIL